MASSIILIKYSFSTEENMRLLHSYLKRHGRPLAFYTDKAALFANTPKSKDGAMSRVGETPPTQIGRALQELGTNVMQSRLFANGERYHPQSGRKRLPKNAQN